MGGALRSWSSHGGASRSRSKLLWRRGERAACGDHSLSPAQIAQGGT